MEESFVVHINCSKIVALGQAAHYTMFIDASKMSIVYELVEWIRWMFSVEKCLYLTHENSVIHELEDIQMLSKLKNFEILPCGQLQCVHKKLYRTLLNNLNLVVSWNDTKVHKYFLDKINQMSEKISMKNSKTLVPANNSKIHQNFMSISEINGSMEVKMVENDYQNQMVESKIANMSVTKKSNGIHSSYKSTTNGESESKMIISEGREPEETPFFFQPDQNFSFSDASLNKYSVTKETGSSLSHSTSFMSSSRKKKKSVCNDLSNITDLKIEKKYIRPFSLGKMLLNLREDYEKKMKKFPGVCENTTEPPGDCNSCVKSFDGMNLSQQSSKNQKKRQRTRKRKQLKGPNIVKLGPAYISENNIPILAINTSKSDCNIKPNHIRFDVDMDDHIINSENNEELNKNELDIPMKKVNNASASEILKNESENSILNDNSQQNEEMNNSDKNGMKESDCLPPTVNQTVATEKLINFEDEPLENVNQLSNSSNNCDSVAFDFDLNNLLSQREKFKKGIVIQRFY